MVRLIIDVIQCNSIFNLISWTDVINTDIEVIKKAF